MDRANASSAPGALSVSTGSNYGGAADASIRAPHITFDASRSNNLYNSSNTVTPKSSTTLFFIKF